VGYTKRRLPHEQEFAIDRLVEFAYDTPEEGKHRRLARGGMISVFGQYAVVEEFSR
jgi:hypothetical protein